MPFFGTKITSAADAHFPWKAIHSQDIQYSYMYFNREAKWEMFVTVKTAGRLK